MPIRTSVCLRRVDTVPFAVRRSGHAPPEPPFNAFAAPFLTGDCLIGLVPNLKASPMNTPLTLVAAAAAALIAATSANAATFIVNGNNNGPDAVVAPGNAPLNTGVSVNAGDTVILAIDPADTWGFNFRQQNALGTYGNGWAPWNWYMPDSVNVPGLSTELGYNDAGAGCNLPGGCIEYGAVAWSIGGQVWGPAYTSTGTTATVTTAYGTFANYPVWTVGRTFTATRSGTLRLAMWDSDTSDNTSGPGSDRTIAVNVTVIPGQNQTATPEPASMLLLAAGLAGLGLARRRRA